MRVLTGWIVCVALMLQSWIGATYAQAQANSNSPLIELVKKSKTCLFIGDSITASGQYIAFFESWVVTQNWSSVPKFIDAGLPSETVSGLSEDGHAGGQFPRPDLAERLDRLLAVTKPDLVFACYGMNCGIYQPLAEERFKLYQAGYKQLKQKVEASGAKLIVITPPFYDDMKKPMNGFSYNDVLGTYAKWLVSQREQGWNVVDLHSAMTSEILNQRKSVEQFSLQPDAVHPSKEGHWCIAKHLIMELGGKLADDSSADAMLKAAKIPAEIEGLMQKRVEVIRNAYVSAAGHKRPGVATGLPIDQAWVKADELSAEINRLIKKD
ncbi:MAG: SGNH/GDSL hydrolase family protein [Pirellulales bacterium]